MRKYSKPFQFEAEKQGFRWFINKFGAACESITDDPTFDYEKEIYVVGCKKPYKQYFMQFDYKNKRWVLLDSKNMEK